MEKERQEKRTKWQRGTRAGNGRRQQGKDRCHEGDKMGDEKNQRELLSVFISKKKKKPTDWYFILCSQFIKILI